MNKVAVFVFFVVCAAGFILLLISVFPGGGRKRGLTLPWSKKSAGSRPGAKGGKEKDRIPHWAPSFEKEFQKNDGTELNDTTIVFSRKNSGKNEEYSFAWRGNEITVGRKECKCFTIPLIRKEITMGRNGCTLIIPDSNISKRLLKITRGRMQEKGMMYLGYTVELLTDKEAVVSYREGTRNVFIKNSKNIIQTTEFSIPDGWKMKILIKQPSSIKKTGTTAKREENSFEKNDIYTRIQEEDTDRKAGWEQNPSAGEDTFRKAPENKTSEHLGINEDEL